MESPALVPQPTWENFLSLLENDGGGTVYVVGGTNAGKTTFCTYLIDRFVKTIPVAYIDCDSGQSTIGPPTTIGLALFQHGSTEPNAEFLRFVGSTSPQGHFLPFLAGAKRLAEKAATLEAHLTLIDSPGYIEYSAAQEFQIRMVDLLHPDHLVAIQRARELEPILAPFRHHPSMGVYRMTLAPEVRVRSQAERRKHREERFRDYFSQAVSHELSLNGMGIHGKIPDSFLNEVWRHLLIALCDWDQIVLTLAIIEHLDLQDNTMTILAPPFRRENLASIDVGSTHIELKKP